MSRRTRHGKQTHKKNLKRASDKTEVGRARNVRRAAKKQEAADVRAAKLKIGKMNRGQARKGVTRLDKTVRRRNTYVAKTDKHIQDAADRRDTRAKAKPKKKDGLFGRMSKGISRAFSKKAR